MDGLTEDPEDGGASAGQPEHREGHGSRQTQLVGGVEFPAWRTPEHTLLLLGIYLFKTGTMHKKTLIS